ncbi:MAG TPA: formyltetrahydrofolate deformylase [Chthoniobacterales bacterium]|nr:formyltetrahydrofolate deformylase [Chthoniobacterales bacterium]
MTAILLISCPDRKGIVAAIATFLYEHGANILHADQHQDSESRLFLMRVEWDLEGFDLDAATFQAKFESIARQFSMTWEVAYSDRTPVLAIFVSSYLHCLADVLHRHQTGELSCRIAVVISNHKQAEPLARFHNVPFCYTPVTAATKLEVERRQRELLQQHSVNLIVLARYMQILSADFVGHYPRQIINVHHSFLPAFAGGRPYHAAFARGVKLIGSSSHYVTDVLDGGPIIEQDVIRVSHRDQVEDLIQKGRDLERIVLSRAVRWHLDHRILCYGNKTVIFD